MTSNQDNKNWKPDLFNAPVPGESLTQPQGAASYEQPPQFTNREDARNYLFDKMTDPRQALKIKKLLEAGVPAEMISNTVIKGGFQSGHWNPDLGLLLAKDALGLVSAIGYRLGVKDMKLFNPDSEMSDFLQTMNQTIETSKPVDLLNTPDATIPNEAQSPQDSQTKEVPVMGGLLGAIKNG